MGSILSTLIFILYFDTLLALCDVPSGASYKYWLSGEACTTNSSHLPATLLHACYTKVALQEARCASRYGTPSDMRSSLKIEHFSIRQLLILSNAFFSFCVVLFTGINPSLTVSKVFAINSQG